MKTQESPCETVSSGFHVIVDDFLGKSRKFENRAKSEHVEYIMALCIRFQENGKLLR